MVLFWLLVIGLIIWVIMRFSGKADARHADVENGQAIEIARERYARGEIGKEEFDQIKKNIA